MNFNNIRMKIQEFMRGRNGIDKYTIFLSVVSLLLLNMPYIFIGGIITTGYTVFRVFSKNINKRRQENYKYAIIYGKTLNFFKNFSYNIKNLGSNIQNKKQIRQKKKFERKNFIVFECDDCKNKLRVPRNKGKIKVKCPVCKKIHYIEV